MTRRRTKGLKKNAGKRKIDELNGELQGIIDWMPVPMPDMKADVVLLCQQAEIGRQCLRERHAKESR